MFVCRATGVEHGGESPAKTRVIGLSPEVAAVDGAEIHASNACGFPVGHAWDGQGDRRCDAAGAAAGSAIQGLLRVKTEVRGL